TCHTIFQESPSRSWRKYCSCRCYTVAEETWGTCAIPDCNKAVKPGGKSYCNAHYLRLIRHGDPLATKRRKPVPKKPSRQPLPSKYCLYCGKPFITKHYGRAKYCNSKCFGLDHRAPFVIKKGYKKILMPSHPRADQHGYVFEHIIILETKLGRPLFPGEVSHHKDGIKLNNVPKNLDTFPSQSEHQSWHRRNPTQPKE